MEKPKLYKPKKIKSKKFGKTRSQKGYDQDWFVYRKRFLHYNKSCYACGSEKDLHVDHLVAHKGNDYLFKKLDNHIPLCSKCHGIVTALFDRSKVPRTMEKLEWFKSKRGELGIDSKVFVLPVYKKRR